MSFVTVSDKVAFIESVFGSAKVSKNGVNADVWCPHCAPTDKTKKKLSIRTDDDRCHCWTCGFKARSLVSLIVKFSSRQKLSEYISRFNPTMPKSRCRSIHIEVKDQLRLPPDFKMLAPSSLSDPDERAVFNYLIDRGLTRDDMWRFKFGTSNEHRWIRRAIVPSFDTNGELNYFVARTIDKRTKPKYDQPDSDKLSIIFNEIDVDWTKQVTLCEGAFDMFKCGDNTVPLLGSDLNEESAVFNALLVNQTPVALALDGNMWETKTLRAAKKLASYNIDVKLVDTRAHEDPGSMTRKEFKDVLAAALPFGWEESFFTKLSRASRISLTVKR